VAIGNEYRKVKKIKYNKTNNSTKCFSGWFLRWWGVVSVVETFYDEGGEYVIRESRE